MIAILIFFERSNLVLHSCNVVENLGRGGVFRSQPVYLMSKSPVRLGLSESVLRETKNVNVTAFNIVIVNISVKNIARAKKFIVGILALAFVSTVSIYC